MIAGPCAIESKKQMKMIFEGLINVDIIRGGAFKPRTNPNDFQGLKKEGINMFANLKKQTNKQIISEIVSIEDIDMFHDVDIIQIGARNMQNYELIKKVARLNKPILLKRGFGNTIDELLSSASYIENEGNSKIMLCERGIRTFENSTRFTLDISAIPILKSRCDYKIIVDPSHAAGDSRFVAPLAKAAVAAGCDGLIIEVHPNPKEALCDKKQQLTLEEFKQLSKEIYAIRNI